ncbi:hypothetical protein NM688_g2940 [Phlebia brevispora]|uniref:Uncharacterized protein n=1 Tax=Phlebia brevispora TaxID=194682 RepID=A0ACC1T7D0_9APHY|nr:hypothetical protein NM688_g2940 [Phlebia brevispora]
MTTSTSNSAIAAVYKAELVYNYSTIACLAFVCYEYLITLKYEYEFLWRRKWTGSTWLFLANRYVLLAVIILTQVALQICHNITLTNFLDVFYELPVLILAVFSALRVFALLDRAYATAGCVFALGLVPVLVYFSYISTKSASSPIIMWTIQFWARHVTMITRYLPQRCSTTLAGLMCMMSADVIAVITTWMKTYRHVRQGTSIGMNVGFSTAILHFGTLYFVVLCVVNVADILILSIPAFQTADPMANFSNILPNIVLSRFLINLRQVNSAEYSNNSIHFSRFSVPNFHVPTLPSIIGNLGEPMADEDRFTYDEEHDDMESPDNCPHELVSPAKEDIEETPNTSNSTSGGIEEVWERLK